MIYLDHSATTPVDKKVLTAMKPYFENNFGNPSSIHSFGQAAIAGVDNARAQVASFLGCDNQEIIFTSGATEANNLALRGIVKEAKKAGLKNPHIIISAIEHDSVIETANDLKEEGVEIDYLPVCKQGFINPEDIKKMIRENTVLVSLMYVNSEVGSIQMIKEAGKAIKKYNQSRLNDWQKFGSAKKMPKPRPVYFHTDATQAVNFFDCRVDFLNVDLLSLSGHKIYGPKGVGALFIKKGTKIKGIQSGGHHEKNFRSGTLNVPGIVGLGKAISLITEAKREASNQKISRLRDKLVSQITKNIPKAILNTPFKNASPAHAHFTFLGAEGESVLIALDLAGIAVSTGSACASESLKPPHVLEAMGIDAETAHYSVRFTLGKNNTNEEIQKLMKILPPIIEKLRKMNPIYKNNQ